MGKSLGGEAWSQHEGCRCSLPAIPSTHCWDRALTWLTPTAHSCAPIALKALDTEAALNCPRSMYLGVTGFAVCLHTVGSSVQLW